MNGITASRAARVLGWLACWTSLTFLAGASGCGPKQVCECAALAGGTTPANAADEDRRSSEVDRCLKEHGGGTTHGCPQPAGMAPMREPSPAPAPAPSGSAAP